MRPARRRTGLVAIAISLLLAACGSDRPPAALEPADPGVADALFAQGQPERAWSAQLACVDCDGIQTALQMQVDDEGGGRYRLLEVFLAAGGGARFAETGQWWSEDGLLYLQGDRGGLRVYAVLADERLQARDLGGGPLAEGSADQALQPVMPTQDAP